MAAPYSAKTYNFQDFDDDDEMSEDEVFMNDKRRNILDDDSGVNKPLMAPRRKVRSNKLLTEVRRGTKYRTACLQLCYALTALGSLTGIICLVVFLINTFVNKFNIQEERMNSVKNDELIGCTSFQVTDVWTQNFPKLTTETAFRLLDVNMDGVQDILMGFGTGADGYNVPTIVCEVYFDGKKPCFGGVLALDGKSGQEMWRHYSDHEVFALNCNEDLNSDGVRDCVIGGRAGVLQAISGKTGDTLWDFGPQDAKNDIMNVYTPQMIPDQDEDGVVDVLIIHGGDPLADPGSAYRLSGRLIILSGKTGKVIQWVGVPDKRESYYSPQLLLHNDGSTLILFGTGGETHPGALWIVTLNDLMKGRIQNAIPIYEDAHKGIMTPPVIVDLNDDGVQDIVMAMFNSTVVAFDGVHFNQLWNTTFPSSETYGTPAAGFFNDDDVPDFFVKYEQGPGFPIYFYADATVLDGKDGHPLLEKSIRDTIGTQASALTVSFEGHGNDMFLYWTADCLGHEGEVQKFTFIKGTNVHEQSRADLCKHKFGTELVSRMYALNQHSKSPGFVVYTSESRKSLENNNTVNTSAEAQHYLSSHPDVANAYAHEKSQNRVHDLLEGNGAAAHSLVHGRHPGGPMIGNHRLKPATTKHSKLAPSSLEYEEDVAYPERHNVRKHGRYRTEHAGHDLLKQSGAGHRQPPPDTFNTHTPSADGYYDYDQEEQQQQQQRSQYGAQHGTPWASKDRLNYGWDVDEQPVEPYGSTGGSLGYPPPEDPYGGLFGDTRDSYMESGGGLQQGSGWPRRDQTYGLQYRPRRLKRSLINERKKSGTKKAKRFRRHVGPHDMGGIQRIISTGTLAPVLDPSAPNANNSIDVIFATYWFFPSKTQAILPEDRDCIQTRMALEEERFKADSKYYGMDHDAYEETITKECVDPSKHRDRNRTFESQSDYDPFNIHMGQMTVYRLKLTCDCQNDVRVEVAGRRCARVKPINEQGWAAYMGTLGDGHFVSSLRN